MRTILGAFALLLLAGTTYMRPAHAQLSPQGSYTDLRKFLDTSVLSISGHGSIAGHLLSGRNRSPGDRAQRADQAVVGGEPVPGHLAGVHDIRQATKHRVGEPVAAQIVPNPLDRIELRAVRRQRQQSDIAGDYQAL